jgi:ATP-dependent 26S proteasome regulatory subunit
VHLRKATLARDVEAEKIAAPTAGFTGADLANLVNETTLLATRRKAQSTVKIQIVGGEMRPDAYARFRHGSLPTSNAPFR